MFLITGSLYRTRIYTWVFALVSIRTIDPYNHFTNLKKYDKTARGLWQVYDKLLDCLSGINLDLQGE